MQILRDIRAIVFDAVGTLLYPDPPAAGVYAEVGRRFGSRLDLETIRTRFVRAFDREELVDQVNMLRTSEQREEQRWRSIVRQVLDDVSEPEACFQVLFDHFSQPRAWRCDPETKLTLETLADRGYVLALASNYDGRLRRVVEGTRALEKIHHLFISSEVGWRKPAAQFFEALVKALAVPPEQILLLGDDRVNDFEGALAAGWSAKLFDPKGEAPDDPRRLERLSDILK